MRIFPEKCAKNWQKSVKIAKNAHFCPVCAFSANFAHFWQFFAKISHIFGDFLLFTPQALPPSHFGLTPLSTSNFNPPLSLDPYPPPSHSSRCTRVMDTLQPCGNPPMTGEMQLFFDKPSDKLHWAEPWLTL